MEEILSVKGLTRKYSPSAGVEGVDFSLRRGEILAYLGHNGAGKTTTVRLLLGLLKAGAGEIRYFGELRDTYSEDFDRFRARIGVCLDNPGFYPDMSAMENLELFAGLYGLEGAAFEEKVVPLLKELELYDVRRDKVSGFSKGMLQKLSLIRAMQHGPELLFLDEPMSGLDPAARVMMRDYLLRLAREKGVSIFLTSHDLNEVEQTADSIVILEKGRVRLSGALKDLKAERAGHGYVVVFRAVPSTEALAAFASALRSSVSGTETGTVHLAAESEISITSALEEGKKLGLEVVEFRREEVSLETIYFDSLRRNETAA